MLKLIRCIPIALFCGSLLAQVAPANQPSSIRPEAAATANQAGAQKEPAKMAPDAPVINIPGLCQSPGGAQRCETVVTRAEYEALANALSAGQAGALTAERRQRLASQYGEMLVFAQEAERRGLDKDPDFEILLRFSRMQVLTQRLLRSIQDQARPSPEEIQKYYDENMANFEAIYVQRIMVPTAHPPKGKDQDTQALVAEMRKRLAAGEDAVKLEEEVYQRLGFKNPVKTALILRVSQLTPEQEPIAKLKAGEVSEVLSEDMTLSIYKSEGRKRVPLDTVKGEIARPLQQQKAQAAIDALLNGRKPVLDDAYFGRIRTRSVHD